MKQCLILLMMCLTPWFAQSQSMDSLERFGVSLNSSFNGELTPIRIVPSLSYTKGKNQVELGFGLHPFIEDDQRIISVDLNQKHFPNGMRNKFNMYFITRLSYINRRIDAFYPSTFNYLFLNAGYGFEIKSTDHVSLGMNITSGAFTYSQNTEISNPSVASKKMFDSIGWNLAFQFNIGYRF